MGLDVDTHFAYGERIYSV